MGYSQLPDCAPLFKSSASLHLVYYPGYNASVIALLYFRGLRV